MIITCFASTALGRIGIQANDSAVTRLFLPQDNLPDEPDYGTNPLIGRAFLELDAYLAGELRDFTIPLRPQGTPFMCRVWQALRDIPYGQTRSYMQIAALLGNPKAARAVGSANNRNPIPLFIPCHRVVGADGSLTGFRGGLEMKRKLLELERGKS